MFRVLRRQPDQIVQSNQYLSGCEAKLSCLLHLARSCIAFCGCSVLPKTQVPEPRTDLSVVYLLYNITKAAMLHGAKLEAADPTLVARGITVAAACPGWCRVRALSLQSMAL